MNLGTVIPVFKENEAQKYSLVSISTKTVILELYCASESPGELSYTGAQTLVLVQLVWDDA